MVRRGLLAAYLLALVASHVTVALHPARPGARDGQQLAALDDGLAIAYHDLRSPDAAASAGAPESSGAPHSPAARESSAARDERPPLLLLHGSPGDGGQLLELADALTGHRRVLVPDLPGFGGSRQTLDDVSIALHARAVTALLDRLGVARAHVVGFSMGGGVALLLPPERVASLTLLSAIGVQELELFGDHDANHAAHQAQFALVQAACWLLPHFGALDTAWARNFLDSDQRPLRGRLLAFDGPALIVHGGHDVLVPVAAAREHARLLPQAELLILDQNHFLPWTAVPAVAARVTDFVDGVDAGRARRRADADPERLARLADPFVPQPIQGAALLLALAALALGTLISEDLSCIGAGMLVAAGRLPFLPAALACMAGIFVGDLLLFLAGRLLGRAALARAPLRWLVSPAAAERGAAWFARRGLPAILVSRFVPGLRLPTYFAAGALRTSLPRFAGYFALAVILWTPLLVGLSVLVGRRAGSALPVALALLVAVHVGLRLASWRGRRRLLGGWRRLTRWEFWPPWAFYPPVVLYVAFLALRHRSLALVTAVNPGIPAGGFLGESKGAILDALGDAAASHVLVRPGGPAAARRAQVRDAGLSPPLVVKPDVGQRGLGVVIVADEAALQAALADPPADLIVQRFVPGPEFGVFYARRPGAERGAILSITDKLLPEVQGDGRRTLEELILADGRAVGLARLYADLHAARLLDVPAAGERVALARLGTHCRGAVFRDGTARRTPAMEQAFERIARRVPGFFFGRFDVRVPDAAALAEGRDITVIELNGLTSEMTHIYDPGMPLLRAWRTLCGQWRLAFEIAAENVRRGARPARLSDLLAALAAFRRHARALEAAARP